MKANDSTRIAELIREGKKLEAIKLLRESTGIGLKEAHEEIERIMRGEPASARSESDAAMGTEGLPAEVEDLVRRGRKIEAIKLLREQRDLGLREARDQVEAYARSGRSGCSAQVWIVLLVSTVGIVLSLLS